jgi:signal transduction histidine kinase
MNRPDTQQRVRTFQVSGVEVRLLPDEKGIRAECSACGSNDLCEHKRTVSAWITLQNFICPTGEPTELKGRLVAMLAQDYRGSFGAVLQAARVFETSESDPKAGEMAAMIQQAAAASKPSNLAERFAQVIEELQAATPDHVIVTDMAIDGPAGCDTRRVEQVLGRLIAHALAQGEPYGSLLVKAWRTDREIMISVTNGASLTPESERDTLRSFRVPRDGSDLPKLDICAEIVRAHGGEMTTTTNGSRACYTFRMRLM